MRDLLKVRVGHASAIDKTLVRLAQWIEEHPDATPDEATQTEEYAALLRAFAAEVKAMHGVLVETLPAVIERGA